MSPELNSEESLEASQVTGAVKNGCGWRLLKNGCGWRLPRAEFEETPQASQSTRFVENGGGWR